MERVGETYFDGHLVSPALVALFSDVLRSLARSLIFSSSFLHVFADEPIPIFLALIMGLQHAFAMIGGLITPPLIIFRFTVCGFPFCPPLEQYAISAALITSGICSIINLSKLPIPYSEKIFGHVIYLGSGVLSVMVRIILYMLCRCNPSDTLTAFAIRFYVALLRLNAGNKLYVPPRVRDFDCSNESRRH
jgi:hypothetical protein